MVQLAMFDDNGAPTPGALPAGQDQAAACSAEALGKVDTEKIERLAEQEFRLYPTGATADEISDRLVGLGLAVDELSVRPRVSALKDRKILFPTGERRKNRKGNSCSVLLHRQFQEGV